MNKKTVDGVPIIESDAPINTTHVNGKGLSLDQWIFIGLFGIVIGGSIIKIVKSIVLPAKSVEAVVIDKHKYNTAAPHSPTGTDTSYIVVFSVNGKRKRFFVSSFTYDGYHIGEKGTLKYKGSRLISFN